MIGRLGAIEALQLELPAPTAAGRDLSGDHPVFDLAPEARASTREALDRGETHYADVPGVAELREAVSRALRAWGLSVDGADGLIITAGEQEGRFLAIQMLAHLGYRVLLPQVVHPGARKAAALGRVDVARVSVDPLTLMPDLASVRRELARGKAALYLESPHRLTGKMMDGSLVHEIADEIARSDGIVIWDAALAPWIAGGTDYVMMGALPGMFEHTVTIGSLWTGTGIEGWLAAYLAGPQSMLGHGRSLKQILAICTTTPAQWAALGALKASETGHRERRDLLQKHKRDAAAHLPSAVVPGEAASVLAVRLSRPVALSELPSRPMRGDAFGAPEIVRFTVTPAGEVVEAMRRLAGAVS
ncbi:MAG: aminotransferase class I/II-fold pyridoxal phosphate-dependent enzyme [Armatimonadota bacterium]